MNRRDLLKTSSIAVGLGATPACLSAAEDNLSSKPSIRYCLNTSTIRGQELDFPSVIDVAAKAGYDAIEPWIREIQRFTDDGGNLRDIRKRIEDHGLTVESAIGFANWIVDDDDQRAKGIETLKHDMDLLRQIGGTRIAAPPVGATRQTDLDLFKAAQRYHDILIIGDQMDVTPQLELWGFSKSISRLGELMLVATESGHASACVLPDVYHIFKGGSDFTGLNMLNGNAIHCFHMNDYPAGIVREQAKDADRVFPGDGTAPLNQILQTIHRNGFRGILSLELFNPDYWKQDAQTVASTGLEKMKAAVRAALG